ncbi:hypothetical protein [Pantoea phytobeneficialis]|uniref:Uncharacterized protein n=1 Tax=Pantoea phytobeneficialis TaxID=2052056 RepID=A0AAP9H6C0_9GAMM|nr:hypothetical protein [Pantoea phytobeneficialis]MDO6409530.1 hypothetical protein [Pantoea phytobeneficialis]QGR07387.1 hypothetical protein CTZ24_13575 [Pantoea phytobeneficialis]
MIMLTLGGKTHELSVADAKQLALAIASEVDRPGQPQRFRGSGIAFSVQSAETASAPSDTEMFSGNGITLTDC